MLLISAALAQGQFAAGVVDDHQVVGVDGPRLGARWLLTPRLGAGAALMVNPAPRRADSLDEILVEIVIDDQYIHPIRADLASLQLGLDGGPIAWTGQGWFVSPRAHLGVEARLEQTSGLTAEGPSSFIILGPRLGAYAGFGAELWWGRVGLRAGWTARSVFTHDPSLHEDAPPGDWGLSWSSSRSLDLLVSL